METILEYIWRRQYEKLPSFSLANVHIMVDLNSIATSQDKFMQELVVGVSRCCAAWEEVVRTFSFKKIEGVLASI